MACSTCGGGDGATTREATPLAAVAADLVRVQMAVPLPYSVLLPMALILYNKDRQRRLTISEARPLVPGPIAYWLQERKVATTEVATTDDRQPTTEGATTAPTATMTPAAAPKRRRGG